MASQPALNQIETAVATLKARIPPKRAREFQDTTLKDVWDALGDVEKRLVAKGNSRSFRRLRSLLDGLQHYAGPLEVLCNGTPYLPWIWIASDHLGALEKLVKAYVDIGNVLPRIDRLSDAFKNEPDFQMVLAAVYCDILEFHERALKMFNMDLWKRFFESSWARFDYRFGNILDSLQKHSELVDREAGALHIASTERWRKEAYDHMASIDAWRRAALNDLTQREKDRRDAQLREVLTWLNVDGYRQEDLLHDLLEKSHPGTSDWLFRDGRISTWIGDNAQRSTLWLTGKPGSGKSVLCAQLIQRLQTSDNIVTAFYLCNRRASTEYGANQALRAIVAQLIMQDDSVLGFVYDEYVLQRRVTSIQQTKQLIATVLSGMTKARIVIDGVDECHEDDQKEILRNILSFASKGAANCKIAIFSQDVPAIDRLLKKHVRISLSEETVMVENSINMYVRHRLEEIKDDIVDVDIPESEVDALQPAILSKANGMFLWVRLVLSSLDKIYNVFDLRKAVDSLPRDINEAYSRILERIRQACPTDAHLQKVKHILSWVVCTERPLRLHEVLDGVTFCSPPYSLDETTKLPSRALDICKPLLEISADGLVSMVHFTASLFVLDRASGPFQTIRDGSYDIALACTAYITTSLRLIDVNISELERMQTVAKGFHNLHSFAHTHWLDYLVKLATAEGTFNPTRGRQLEESISQLCNYHSNLLATLQCQPLLIGSDESLDDRAHLFARFRPLRTLAASTWDAQRRLYAKQPEAEPDNSPVDDPTLFTNATKQYEAFMERLLAPDSELQYPSLAQDISTLKTQSFAKSFTCSFMQCPYRSDGFASKAEKMKHERSHQPRLMCKVAACPFTTSIGFATKAQLKKHVRDYHSATPVLPPFPNPHRPGSGQEDTRSLNPTQLHDEVEPIDYQDSDQTQIPEAQQAPGSVASPYSEEELDRIGNKLGMLRIDRLEPEFKVVGDDWGAVFNPRLKRQSNIDLVHTFSCGDPVICVCFSADGNFVAIGSDRGAYIYETVTGALRQALPWPLAKGKSSHGSIRATCFTPDSRCLVGIARSDDTIRIWDIVEERFTQSFTGGGAHMSCLDVASNGCFVASGSDEMAIRLWDLGTNQCTKCLQTDYVPTSVAISHDSKMIVAGTIGFGPVGIWNVADGHLVKIFHSHRGAFEEVAWGADFKHVLASSIYGEVNLWDIGSGECVRTFEGYSNAVSDVKFGASDQRVFCACHDGTVHVWNTSTGDAEMVLHGHADPGEERMLP